MELLSEPDLTMIAGLDHWFDQGWQEGSGVITSKRVVVEWTLACAMTSILGFWTITVLWQSPDTSRGKSISLWESVDEQSDLALRSKSFVS